MDQLEIPAGPPPKLRRNITMAFNCTQCGTLTSDSEGFYDYPNFCGSCVEKAQMDERKQPPFPKIANCHVCKRQVDTAKALQQANVVLCDIKCRKTFFKTIQKQAKDELNSRSISIRDLVECQTCHKLAERHKCFIRTDKYFCSFKCCLSVQDGRVFTEN
jgi:hypothetical protein